MIKFMESEWNLLLQTVQALLFRLQLSSCPAVWIIVD